MGVLEWMDLYHYNALPPDGAEVYYRPAMPLYVGKGYVCKGKFYTYRHTLIEDVRWWAFPSDTVASGYVGIYQGVITLQYSAAWGIIQDVIVREKEILNKHKTRKPK